jgi:hypothetical protein
MKTNSPCDEVLLLGLVGCGCVHSRGCLRILIMVVPNLRVEKSENPPKNRGKRRKESQKCGRN